MSVVAIISAKGGVGKTTVTAGLASAGWAAERKQLVIDADPLGHLTYALGIDEADGGLGSLIRARRAPSLDSLVVTSGWDPDTGVVPAGGLDPEVSGENAGRITTLLREASKLDQLVLVDAPAGLGPITAAILEGANAVLVVTEPSVLGIMAAADTDAAIAAAQKRNRSLVALGLVVNRLPGRGREAAARLAELEREAGRRLWRPAVPQRVVLGEAMADGTPIHAWGVRGAEVAGIFDSYLARLMRTLKA